MSLSIVFRNCVNQCIFPDIWKKPNICPICQKGDKQVINNYRLVSLLQICRKLFEALIFKYKLLISLVFKQIIPVQIKRCPLSIIFIQHLTQPTLESCGVFWICLRLVIKYDTRSSFLNLNQWGFIESFFGNRFQRVTLNGQASMWLPVIAGVPRGSILEPLSFLIYINDLPTDIVSTVKLFADYTTPLSIITDVETKTYELIVCLHQTRNMTYLISHI